MRYLRDVCLLFLFVTPAAAQDMPLSDILLPNEGWKPVARGYKLVGALTADRQGRIYIAAYGGERIDRLDGDKVAPFVKSTEKIYGLCFGPDDRLYGAQYFEHRIVSWDAEAKMEKLVEGIEAGGLTVTPTGQIFYLKDSNVFLIPPGGKPKKVLDGEDRWGSSAILAWPDGGTLLLGQWAFRIEKDGSLSGGDRYYRPQGPQGEKVPHILNMTMDDKGRAYFATPQGVQVFDPTGRLSGVLLKPEHALVTAVAFGGADGDMLYMACGDAVYARKTKAKRVFPVKLMGKK